MVMAKIMEVMPGSKISSISTTSTNDGIPERISNVRCMTVSVRPPFIPENKP